MIISRKLCGASDLLEFYMIKKICKGLLVVASGFLLGVLAVVGLRKKPIPTVEKIDVEGVENYAELVKEKTKVDILNKSCNVVASEFECVGQSIDNGRKRFNDSVQNLLDSK